MSQYDLVIVGGGPAGVGAGVYAARKKLHTILLTCVVDTQENFGGQSVVSQDIQNWIGTVSISGPDLAKNLEEHLNAYAGDRVDVKKDEEVTAIEKSGEGFVVKSEKGSSYETATVLVATGSTRRKLTVPGAEEFEHKGITYCASCDGPLFTDKDVVVVGGGNAGFETAAQLLAYTKSVTLLEYNEEYKADPVTVEKVLADSKMTGVTNTELSEVYGEGFVTGLKYKDRASGEEKNLKTDGVFVEIGLIPASDVAITCNVELNKHKQISIDPWTQRTSVEGIWAAGDVTNVRYHQNNIAAGDAVRALEDIYVYLKAQ